LFSSELGISGISDVVEFYRKNEPDESCCQLENKDGWWQPYPVEYKRGKTKSDQIDEVQLCAQAICLEEMLKVKIKSGSLYYGSENRRHEVTFTSELRSLTADTAKNVHSLFETKITPRPEFSKKCSACSMYEICIPKKDNRKNDNYLKLIFGEGD
jgi:CRISPR-associated exonuclease Cas4